MPLEFDKEFELMSEINDLKETNRRITSCVGSFLKSLHVFMRTARVLDPEGSRMIDVEASWLPTEISKSYTSPAPKTEWKPNWVDGARLITKRANEMEGKWRLSGHATSPAFQDVLKLAIELETELLTSQIDSRLRDRERGELKKSQNSDTSSPT